MSGHEARQEVAMPQQVVYSEDHPAVRWQMVTIVTLSWALMIGCGIAMNLPHLVGLGVLAIIGGTFALIYTLLLLYAMDVSFRAYEDSIQIGGLRGRDRRLRRGTWPPRKVAGSSSKAVFICPWQATDGLYVLTERSDIKRIRQDLGRFRKRTSSTRNPLGVFTAATYFADAFLVISNDPSRTESEPREFKPVRGQDHLIWPVASPTWLVPIRNPGAFRAAVQRLPQAPPVYDRLPEGHVRFEIS
jgi:uncharacterized protein (DUF58 family)